MAENKTNKAPTANPESLTSPSECHVNGSSLNKVQKINTSGVTGDCKKTKQCKELMNMLFPMELNMTVRDGSGGGERERGRVGEESCGLTFFETRPEFVSRKIEYYIRFKGWER